jgi:hypothetical protein
MAATTLEVACKVGVLKMDNQNNEMSLRLYSPPVTVKLEFPESVESHQMMMDLCDCKLTNLHYLRVKGGSKLYLRQKENEM